MNKNLFLSGIIRNDESLRIYLDQLEHTNISRMNERDARIVGNYRLALSVTAEYLNQGLEPADVFGFAMQGLTMAVDHFDNSLGTDFPPYAMRWIRGAVCAALTQVGHTIRLPKHVRKMIDESPEDEVSQWLRQLVEPMDSLDRPIATDGERSMSLGDIIPDEESNDALHEYTENLLERVSSQQREVLIRHYFHGEDFETVGRAMHLSAARIRQIHNAALRINSATD
ncbi:MAG: sigma-70 family RNA polymerase sigma factor [Paludibacteraceae bacterium]|nr:sigma-70 family RNA polymerase sigma factor [Paludibacteraceae bacterium]